MDAVDPDFPVGEPHRRQLLIREGSPVEDEQARLILTTNRRNAINRCWFGWSSAVARVWALRGLLWSWDPRAGGCVCEALGDDSWRVREMAAKVVARHLVGEAASAVARLRDDPVQRVRDSAERALMRLSAAGA